MLVRLIVTFLFIFKFQASASCLLSDAMKDPKLSGNSEFWEDYSKLSAKGNVPDKDLQNLITKHSKQSSLNTENKTSPSISNQAYRLNINSQAKKDISRLSKNLKDKMDDFMDIAVQKDGLKKIRDNPGSWRLEKVIENRKTYHTVRLNDGYRVLFDYDSSGELKIFSVSKSVTH